MFIYLGLKLPLSSSDLPLNISGQPIQLGLAPNGVYTNAQLPKRQ